MPNFYPKHEISLFLSIGTNLKFFWVVGIFAAEGGGDTHHVECSYEFVGEGNYEYEHK